MIATYVSSENDLLLLPTLSRLDRRPASWGRPTDYEFIAEMKRDFRIDEPFGQMKALLNIAGKVQQGGKQVMSAMSKGPPGGRKRTRRFTIRC